MKKSMVLLAGIGMAFLGMPAVSHAQAASGPFADVPTDHWAYQSVDTLQKAGIVIGYPDGTYGGRRPMTRYEFAVAIARLLAQMNKGGASAADLAALRTDLENRIAGNTAAIDALRTLVNGFQTELTRLGQDVAAANARLDSLEARVNALTGRVDNLDGKVAVLAAEDARFHVTGEVNVIAEGVSSRRGPVVVVNGKKIRSDSYQFLDRNGNAQPFNPSFDSRLLGNTDVYNDILLHIRGKVAENATANIDLDFGNYLSAVGNTASFPGRVTGAGASSLAPGSLSAGNQYANVYKAYLDAAVKLGPLGGAELLVGRFGTQYTKYTLKQADADVYTNLIQTDSGDTITDGIGASLKLGPAHVNAFAGKLSAIPYSRPYGGTVGVTPTFGNPFSTGQQTRPGGLIAANHAAPFDQMTGVRATFGAPEGFVVGATLIEAGLNSTNFANDESGRVIGFGLQDPNRNANDRNGQFNRLSVYGLDLNGALPFGLPGVKKGGILVDAAYTVSAHGYNNNFNGVGSGFRYSSQEYNAGFAIGPVQIKGGYQYVGPDFSAPGYWGKLGAWSNPTNVRGPIVSAKIALTPKLSFNADGQFYTAAYGQNKNGTAINSPLRGAVDYIDTKGKPQHGGADHVSRYQVGLGYGLSSTYGVDLGYEDVQYDIRNQNGGSTNIVKGGRPEENYTTIGLGHTFSPNASVKLLYQIVHYDDKGTGFGGGVPGSPNFGGKSDGSVATAQFQLKF